MRFGIQHCDRVPCPSAEMLDDVVVLSSIDTVKTPELPCCIDCVFNLSVNSTLLD